MSVEFYRGSPGKFDSRTLSRETLGRWTGRTRLIGAGSVRVYNSPQPRSLWLCVAIGLQVL